MKEEEQHLIPFCRCKINCEQKGFTVRQLAAQGVQSWLSCSVTECVGVNNMESHRPELELQLPGLKKEEPPFSMGENIIVDVTVQWSQLPLGARAPQIEISELQRPVRNSKTPPLVPSITNN